MNTKNEKLDPRQRISIPFFAHPLFKVHYAHQQGIHKNLMFSTWGGIGDVICSEPTIRYAVNNFKDCKIGVATHVPEVFAHLKNEIDIYDLKIEKPVEDDWLFFHTIPRQDESNMIPLFLSHLSTNCVDFASLSALKAQLPIKNRHVHLRPSLPTDERVLSIVDNYKKHVIVHAGRHWKSKTFPVSWWEKALKSIKDSDFTPVLIGKDGGESQGYVEVDAEGCIDLRDQTSLNDSIWLLQNSGVVFCNDSAPLHMAASGRAWILFVASVKHADYITHFRKDFKTHENVWSWRMQDLSLDGVWNYYDICPNKNEDVNVDDISPEVMAKILPVPQTIGPLCAEKMNDYCREI